MNHQATDQGLEEVIVLRSCLVGTPAILSAYPPEPPVPLGPEQTAAYLQYVRDLAGKGIGLQIELEFLNNGLDCAVRSGVIGVVVLMLEGKFFRTKDSGWKRWSSLLVPFVIFAVANGVFYGWWFLDHTEKQFATLNVALGGLLPGVFAGLMGALWGPWYIDSGSKKSQQEKQ